MRKKQSRIFYHSCTAFFSKQEKSWKKPINSHPLFADGSLEYWGNFLVYQPLKDSKKGIYQNHSQAMVSCSDKNASKQIRKGAGLPENRMLLLCFWNPPLPSETLWKQGELPNCGKGVYGYGQSKQHASDTGWLSVPVGLCYVYWFSPGPLSGWIWCPFICVPWGHLPQASCTSGSWRNRPRWKLFSREMISRLWTGSMVWANGSMCPWPWLVSSWGSFAAASAKGKLRKQTRFLIRAGFSALILLLLVNIYEMKAEDSAKEFIDKKFEYW